MRNLLLISLLSIKLISYAQPTWVVHNDSLFLKVASDSLYINEYSQYTTAKWGSIYGNISNQTDLLTGFNNKQATLVSGTNIKTVNGNSLLGSGDVSIAGSAAWGSVTGTLSNQTDLNNALAGKQASITTGTTAQYFRGDLSLATFPTTTAAFTNSTNKNFVTDAQATVIGNTSNSNSGDNATNTQYSGLVSNANHTGDATGSTALTLATVNSNVGSFGSATQAGTFTVNAKGLITAASNTTIAIPESAVTNLVPDLAAKAPLASPALVTPTFSAGTIGIPMYGRVTGSNFTTTGQVLVDITGLSVALTTNATYEIEVNIGSTVTAVTTGNQFGINYSVAGGTIEAQITGSLTSTAAKTERITALNTATSAFLTTSAQTGGVRITGIVTTGANAGNLTAKILKVTSGTATAFINSFIKVTRIL